MSGIDSVLPPIAPSAEELPERCFDVLILCWGRLGPVANGACWKVKEFLRF